MSNLRLKKKHWFQIPMDSPFQIHCNILTFLKKNLWDSFFDETVAPKKGPYMGLWFHEQDVILNGVMVDCNTYTYTYVCVCVCVCVCRVKGPTHILGLRL